MSIDDIIVEKFEQAVSGAMAKFEVFVARPVMTRAQLAEYWQVEERSITNWMAHTPHPLPVHYVGTAPRFHKVEVDVWSREGGTKLIDAARDIGVAD